MALMSKYMLRCDNQLKDNVIYSDLIIQNYPNQYQWRDKKVEAVTSIGSIWGFAPDFRKVKFSSF